MKTDLEIIMQILNDRKVDYVYLKNSRDEKTLSFGSDEIGEISKQITIKGPHILFNDKEEFINVVG